MLVVDDSVVARRIVSEIIDEEEDLEVVGTAANGRIALAKLPRLDPDVVTLDIDMPELDGLETLSRIRAEHPHVQVIIVTGHASRQDMKLAKELGAFDYLEKPVDIGELAEKIKQARARAEAIAPRASGDQPCAAATPSASIRRRWSWSRAS